MRKGCESVCLPTKIFFCGTVKMNTAKRVRKTNWVAEEIAILLRELQREGPNLFSKNSMTNTTKGKAATWQRISEKVSALGHAMRTAEEVKLKWKGLKKEIFEKDREARMTGGGPFKIKFIPYEEIIRDVIGQGSALFSGVEVPGCDTCNTGPPPQTKEVSTVPLSVSLVPSIESPAIPEMISIPADGQVTVGPECNPPPSNSNDVDGEATMPQEGMNDSAEAPAPPCTPVGFKTRLLQKKRKRPTGMCRPSTTGTAASAAEEDQWPVYKEFQQSETQKNKLKIEKLKKELEESDERREGEIVERNLRQVLYRSLIENAQKGVVPSFPLP